MERTVDGNAGLKEQENQLSFAENVAIVKLVSYAQVKPPGPAHFNLATFEKRDITVVPPPLSLIELSAGQTAESVLAQNPGKKVVFNSDIFVSDTVKKIVGIR